MAKEKQSGESWLYKLAIAVLPSMLNIVYYLKHVVRHEIERALGNLVVLVVLCAFAGLLLVSAWFCVLGVLYTYLLSLNLTTIAALSLVLLFNVLVFIFTWVGIVKTKNKITQVFDRIR